MPERATSSNRYRRRGSRWVFPRALQEGIVVPGLYDGMGQLAIRESRLERGKVPGTVSSPGTTQFDSTRAFAEKFGPLTPWASHFLKSKRAPGGARDGVRRGPLRHGRTWPPGSVGRRKKLPARKRSE